MQSIQYALGDKDFGGIGANFIIEWGALKPVTSPLIQAVMVGTSYKLGISFVSDAIDINETRNGFVVDSTNSHGHQLIR